MLFLRMPYTNCLRFSCTIKIEHSDLPQPMFALYSQQNDPYHSFKHSHGACETLAELCYVHSTMQLQYVADIAKREKTSIKGSTHYA